GMYDVRLERAKGSLVARTQVADGARVVLDSREFGQAAPPDPTQRRGPAPSRPRYAVSGRNRVELIVGAWRAGRDAGIVTSGTTADVMGGLGFTHYVREDLAMTFTLAGAAVQEEATVTARSVTAGS